MKEHLKNRGEFRRRFCLFVRAGCVSDVRVWPCKTIATIEWNQNVADASGSDEADLAQRSRLTAAGHAMRIGILSDTHDELARTHRAVALRRDVGVEALIHCGDFIEPKIVSVCSALPLWFVFGNNDSDSIPEFEFTTATSICCHTSS